MDGFVCLSRIAVIVVSGTVFGNGPRGGLKGGRQDERLLGNIESLSKLLVNNGSTSP